MAAMLGAEFTQLWARRRGAGADPEPGAVKVYEREQRGRAAPVGSA